LLSLVHGRRRHGADILAPMLRACRGGPIGHEHCLQSLRRP